MRAVDMCMCVCCTLHVSCVYPFGTSIIDCSYSLQMMDVEKLLLSRFFVRL